MSIYRQEIRNDLPLDTIELDTILKGEDLNLSGFNGEKLLTEFNPVHILEIEEFGEIKSVQTESEERKEDESEEKKERYNPYYRPNVLKKKK
jgi:hypothetical protein